MVFIHHTWLEHSSSFVAEISLVSIPQSTIIAFDHCKKEKMWEPPPLFSHSFSSKENLYLSQHKQCS